MRLQPVEPYPRFRIQCQRCNKEGWSNHGNWHADLDGTPWKAYYCEQCANTLKQESRNSELH